MSVIPKPLEVGITAYVRRECYKCKFFEFIITDYNSMVYNAEQAYKYNRVGFIKEINKLVDDPFVLDRDLCFPLIFVNGKLKKDKSGIIDEILSGQNIPSWMPSFVAFYEMGKEPNTRNQDKEDPQQQDRIF